MQIQSNKLSTRFDPLDQIQSNKLTVLKRAAEVHVEFSEIYLPELRRMTPPEGSEINPNPWKTLKEGSYYLANAYDLVQIYKKCLSGVIQNKDIKVINATIYALEFDPMHITNGYTEEAYGGQAKCFVSTGQDTMYYNLLHSESKKDVRFFIDMVERFIEAPVMNFLESVKQILIEYDLTKDVSSEIL